MSNLTNWLSSQSVELGDCFSIEHHENSIETLNELSDLIYSSEECLQGNISTVELKEVYNRYSVEEFFQDSVYSIEEENEEKKKEGIRERIRKLVDWITSLFKRLMEAYNKFKERFNLQLRTLLVKAKAFETTLKERRGSLTGTNTSLTVEDYRLYQRPDNASMKFIGLDASTFTQYNTLADAMNLSNQLKNGLGLIDRLKVGDSDYHQDLIELTKDNLPKGIRFKPYTPESEEDKTNSRKDAWVTSDAYPDAFTIVTSVTLDGHVGKFHSHSPESERPDKSSEVGKQRNFDIASNRLLSLTANLISILENTIRNSDTTWTTIDTNYKNVNSQLTSLKGATTVEEGNKGYILTTKLNYIEMNKEQLRHMGQQIGNQVQAQLSLIQKLTNRSGKDN